LITLTTALLRKPIASGDVLVAATDSALYDFIKWNFGDALAVEMEGYGFLEALRPFPEIDSLVVRGISDLCDGGIKRLDLAAPNAAAFCFQVLSELDQKKLELSQVSVGVHEKSIVVYDPGHAATIIQGRLRTARQWLCELPQERVGSFWGRHREIADLQRLLGLAEANHDGPTVAVISGKPGVGKSVLVQRLASTLSEGGLSRRSSVS
jgi:hypothetical protein